MSPGPSPVVAGFPEANRITRYGAFRQARTIRRDAQQPQGLSRSTSLLDETRGSLVRRAQTTHIIPHIQHYIQGKDGSPACVACGGYPDNAHVLWVCPGGRAAMGESLKHIPINLRPATLEEWLADSSPDIMKALLGHLKLLGLSDG
ncbi:hypothetical protein HPB52_024822 [Rhipicephalus sanguineus]|uniref:Uncharacterized protein n=1 Tax=Rhipicephalus sanguineus TaxID=34632 RepID=A0A9D4TDW2_RHISA|nr:hypothetical protein HPB52_024822 [Rhipicephalus sanguineus]